MLNNRIQWVLGKDERARADDRVLLYEVWKTYGFYLSDSQLKIFMGLPSAESIRRTRQKLNEQGKYLPSEPVRKARKFKGLSVQQRITSTPTHKIDPLLNERLI